jgi:hypothetical protein
MRHFLNGWCEFPSLSISDSAARERGQMTHFLSLHQFMTSSWPHCFSSSALSSASCGRRSFSSRRSLVSPAWAMRRSLFASRWRSLRRMTLALVAATPLIAISILRSSNSRGICPISVWRLRICLVRVSYPCAICSSVVVSASICSCRSLMRRLGPFIA